MHREGGGCVHSNLLGVQVFFCAQVASSWWCSGWCVSAVPLEVLWLCVVLW